MRVCLLTLILAGTVACATLPATSSPASIAHLGTDAVKALTTFQGEVIRLSDAGVLPLDPATKMMDAIFQGLTIAQRLSALLKEYDRTRANLDEVIAQASQLMASVAAIPTAAPLALVPASQKLVASTTETVGAIKVAVTRPPPAPASPGCKIIGTTDGGVQLECPKSLFPPATTGAP